MLNAPTVQSYHPDGYPEQTGRRKALCIGINYVSRQGCRRVHEQLSGCINDALRIKNFLSNHWRSSVQGAIEIKVLKDDKNKADQIPTRSNIIKAMRWLVKDAAPGDSLVFHYSGHGGQILDTNGDEEDGYDEVIYPVDGDHILDDDMHDLMVKPLPPGCRLTALFDCCNSGSALDLPYVWHESKGLTLDGSVTKKWSGRKSTSAGVISLSSTNDSEMSMDTPQGGAMSQAFISSLTPNRYPTYKELFSSIRSIMEHQYGQTPQLCCSSNIDTNISFAL
ncbi:peptidase C14 [Armillaria nabsnona]|nr:peptidase C14 [Armillaria nabsnona]